MSFPFNFAKISKGCHFMVCGSKNLKFSSDTAISTFQKDVLSTYYCCYPLSVINLLSAVTREPK